MIESADKLIPSIIGTEINSNLRVMKYYSEKIAFNLIDCSKLNVRKVFFLLFFSFLTIEVPTSKSILFFDSYFSLIS